MKIYLAGKIARDDWRWVMLGRKNHWEGVGEWPLVAYEGHQITGPYFIGYGHGCTHGDTLHGVDAGNVISRQQTVALCQKAIDRSDVVFCHIDDVTAYGSLVEIGYAAAKRKIIWISKEAGVDARELWFAFHHATKIKTVTGGAWTGLDSFLEVIRLRQLPYPEYLQTSHWQDTRQAALERARHRCQVCAATAPLDVHHNSYVNVGEEEPADLIALCRGCHSKFHLKMAAPPRKPELVTT